MLEGFFVLPVNEKCAAIYAQKTCMGDRVSPSQSECEYISGVLERFGKPALDQCPAEFRRCDHKRLLETALCRSPEILHAPCEIRRLLPHCQQVAEP